jgi:hypothetical protein
MKHSSIRQAIFRAGHLGAVCLSFFILPGVLEFTEDMETLFDTFEMALYLRIFFSWFSIWFTLSFVMKTFLATCIGALDKIRGFFKNIFGFFFNQHRAAVSDAGQEYRELAQLTPFYIDEDGSSSSKPQGKGFKFPTVFPRKFLRRFRTALKSMGNLGFANKFSLWGFNIDEKFIDRSADSDFRRKQKKGQRTKTQNKRSAKGLKALLKKVAKAAKEKPAKPKAAKPAKAKKAAKPAKAAKAAKPAKAAKVKPAKGKAAGGAKKAGGKAKKADKLISKKQKEGAKAIAKAKKEELKGGEKKDLQKAAGKQVRKDLAKKINKMMLKSILKKQAKENAPKEMKDPKPVTVKTPTAPKTSIYKFNVQKHTGPSKPAGGHAGYSSKH